MTNISEKYGLHPSTRLQALFEASEIPHQGQVPDAARVLVFGLDANYSPRIAENREFFASIEEYHRDGVAFWQRHGVHHPFLLDSYPYDRRTGGVPYHRRFAGMELTPAYAKYISFVELIHVPTTGRTTEKEFWQLFDPDHARRLDNVVRSGAQRLVLLSRTLMCTKMALARDRFGVFSWVPGKFNMGEMKRLGETVLYGAPHFSSTTYKESTFKVLGEYIRDFCDGCRG